VHSPFGVWCERVASRGLDLRVGPRRRVIGPLQVSPFGGSRAAERGWFVYRPSSFGTVRLESLLRPFGVVEVASRQGAPSRELRIGAAGGPSGTSRWRQVKLLGVSSGAAVARPSGREPRANATARDPHVGETRRRLNGRPSGRRVRWAVRAILRGRHEAGCARSQTGPMDLLPSTRSWTGDVDPGGCTWGRKGGGPTQRARARGRHRDVFDPKPMGASSGPRRKRRGSATDSPAEQGLEVEDGR
jgi:hypothetical protein